jgi:hypothetical protein
MRGPGEGHLSMLLARFDCSPDGPSISSRTAFCALSDAGASIRTKRTFRRAKCSRRGQFAHIKLYHDRVQTTQLLYHYFSDLPLSDVARHGLWPVRRY